MSFTVFFNTFTQSEYTQTILEKRASTRQLILNDTTVLNKLEQLGIQDLAYYEINESLNIDATFIKNKGKKFLMPTSTERTPTYRRVGYLCFEIDEQAFQLSIYKNLELKGKKYKNYYFIPFKDQTAPEETYGGGRYLDLNQKLKRNAKLKLDFNKAYNPYCVYSHRFSCPLVPAENHLEVKIKAGEKLPILQIFEE